MIVYFLSYYATTEEIPSHWFWHYKKLVEASTDSLQVKVISKKSESPAEGYLPLLKDYGFGNSFSTKRIHLCSVDAERVATSIIDESSNILVVYEGGLRELILTEEILKRTKNLRIIFNFYNIEAWHSVFQNNKMRYHIGELIQSSRLCFTREIMEAAQDWPHEIPTASYPIFSTLEKASQTSGEKNQVALFIYDLATANEYLNEKVVHGMSDLTVHVFGDKKSLKIFIPRLRSLLPKVEVLGYSGNIPECEYARVLSLTSQSIFLMSPKTYALKSSGKVEDAIMRGSVPKVPLGAGPATQNNRKLQQFTPHNFTLYEISPLSKINSVSISDSLKTLKSIAHFDVISSSTDPLGIGLAEVCRLNNPSTSSTSDIFGTLSKWSYHLNMRPLLRHLKRLLQS